MSHAFEFLSQCDFFVLATSNDTVPAARPFGAVMEYKDALYFSTANTKDVYAQLVKNPSIQIVAKKPDVRDWIRINGKECDQFALVKVLEKESLIFT